MSTDLLPDDDDDTDGDERKSKRQADFLLAEYSSIAQAYFNTTTTIATFFKNYLVIVGLPIPIFVFLLTQLSRAGNLPSMPDELAPLIPITAGLIGLLGFAVMIYVINLRLDALLYARTVNGIRKYFYEHSEMKYPDEMRMRVLPRSTLQPRYFEWHYFMSVIAVFTILNAFYPLIGLGWYLHHEGYSVFVTIYAGLGIVIISLVVHFFTYWVLTRYRETKYLRTFKIGVDIDGVLNKHREHFCSWLEYTCGKKINPDDITFVPVHKCHKLNVTEAEEHAVFNHPGYWRDLPPMEGAAEVLTKLKRVFGYKIFIFTHRPWPEPKQFPATKRNHYRYLWSLQKFWRPLGAGVIWLMTKQWLKKHGIPYNKLLVEKGNVHTSDRRILVNNRFTVAERREIRIFIEDDLFKARKLANICEIVFLVKHPYNGTNDLPKNIIPVEAWQDILEFIRQEL